MKSRHDTLVSELCNEIDYLEQKLDESRKNEKYWRDKYNEILNDSLKHNQAMIGNVLTAMLDPKQFESA